MELSSLGAQCCCYITRQWLIPNRSFTPASCHVAILINMHILGKLMQLSCATPYFLFWWSAKSLKCIQPSLAAPAQLMRS